MGIKKPIAKPETQVSVNKFFKTIEQMSLMSGIGENTLRLLVENGEIDYISIGNRRLIADSAIWDWYDRNKVTATIWGILRSMQSVHQCWISTIEICSNPDWL